MIIIESPEKEVLGDSVVLSTRFRVDGKSEVLWYKFPAKFEEYLVIENVDAALVGLLLLGLKTGQDIQLHGPVSGKLLYGLNHYLIRALCVANLDFYEIKIHSVETSNEDLNKKKTAGAGFSCGVDSFATFYSHFEEKPPYAVEYLTFLNAGSHGDFGGQKARQVYQKRLKSVKEFSKKVGKDLISIDSNLSDILKLNFQKTNTYRSVSCILNLQKLFKNYYYASSFPLDLFQLSSTDTSYYDTLNLSMLSTESTTFFSTDVFWSRIEKTSYIAMFSDSYDYLDVCTNLRDEFETRNCSCCDKCLRTAITLELLGKLSLYQKVFDIREIRRNKNRFIGKILATKDKNVFNKDLCKLLDDKNGIKPVHLFYKYDYLYKMYKQKLRKTLTRQ